MKHNLKYVISLVFMLLLTQSTWADPTVTIIKKLNGAVVTETSPGVVADPVIASGKCTLTVTPAQGYYVTKDFITAYSVVTGGAAQTPRRSPDLDNDPIEVRNAGENTDPTGVTTYEFDMPTDGSDVEVTVDFHSYQSYALYIGETQVTDLNADKILGDSKVTFTPGNDNNNNINTLTLNGATLTVPIKVALPNLTIDIQGTNSITTEETCLQKIDDAAPAVTFKSTSSPVGSLTLKTTGDGGVNTFGEYNVGSFSISEELTLIMKNSGYVYSNTYYFTDGTTKEAVFAPAYDIIVGEMPVTMGNADDIFGGYNDGQVSYDAENNILTLNSASLYGEGKNIVYSGSENLTIALNGSCYVNSIIYSGQGETLPQLTFKKVEGALPGTTLRTPTDFRENFSTVNYEDWLGLHVDNSYPNDVFYDVVSKTPSIYGNWNYETEKWMITVESNFEGTVKYSLTYADENLTANNKTNVPFEEAFTLLGPATIKATITIDDVVSPEETAYYFGIMPNPLRFVYDGETLPTFEATLYPNVEGVTFTPYSSPGSFATLSEGEITINGYGSGLVYASLNLPESRTFSTITDSIAFKMEVVPPVPTITLASGSYSSTHDPIVIQGPDIADSKIMYKWNDEEEACEYEEAIPVQNGTLTAWVEVEYNTTTGATVASDKVSADYTVSYPITFVGTNSWASYYVTENLNVPEGLTAYIIDDADDKTGIVLASAIGYIPRHEAVLLKRTNTAVSEYTATAYDDEEDDDIFNLLKGTDQAASIEDILMWEGYVTNATVYVLYNDEFVKATGTIPANRGFLVFGEEANAPKLTIEIGDGATGINSIENGKLTIDNSEVYNLAGQRVAQPTKGLYIKNGKKILVK